jgi:hypothetical protein
MPSDLTVDVGALRHCATAVSTLGARTSTGVAQSPPLGVTAPGWATTDALTDLATVAERRWDALADALAVISRRLTDAIDAYESTDTRAALRLRSLR